VNFFDIRRAVRHDFGSFHKRYPRKKRVEKLPGSKTYVPFYMRANFFSIII
jgi:hypothetical protein